MTAHATFVYIADDSEVVRSALAGRLTAEGVSVHSGASLAEALGLAALTVRGFSCALLDLDLGDGSGADVADHLRVHQPVLPVAFFSGGATAEVVARAQAIGPIFRKPEDLEDAVAWVKRHAALVAP